MRIRDLRSHCGTVVVLQQCQMLVLAIMVDITVVVAPPVEIAFVLLGRLRLVHFG